MCVSSCPTTSYSPLAAASVNIESEETIKKKMAPYCDRQLANSMDMSVKQLVDKSICPAWYLASQEVFGRLPFISAEDEKVANVTQTDLEKGRYRYSLALAARQLWEQVFNDLHETYWMICVTLLGAAFLSLIWIVLMGFVAGPLLYITIIVVILGQVGLLVFCSVRLYQSWLSSDPEADKNIFQLNWTPEIVDDFLNQSYTWLAFTCILGILLLLSLCLLAFLWERIRIAVALIHEASKAVAQLCPTLLFPFLPSSG